jgi:ArsR family transcriptional regulator
MTAAASPDIPRAAALFHALSDPRRLRIVQLLAAGERCVCELTAALGAAQPLLSFHLKELKNAGLVADRRHGRWAYYRLRSDVLRELLDRVTALTAADPAAAPCCGPDGRPTAERRPHDAAHG